MFIITVWFCQQPWTSQQFYFAMDEPFRKTSSFSCFQSLSSWIKLSWMIENRSACPFSVLDPPLLAPQISGYINGKPLYQGDPLTLTCAVAGGDPLVTSVTLTCPGHHDQGPNSGQSSSLVIPALSDADNNVTCVCSGQWARPQFYTTTSSVTLTVYCKSVCPFPPSTRFFHTCTPELDMSTVECNLPTVISCHSQIYYHHSLLKVNLLVIGSRKPCLPSCHSHLYLSHIPSPSPSPIP